MLLLVRWVVVHIYVSTCTTFDKKIFASACSKTAILTIWPNNVVSILYGISVACLYSCKEYKNWLFIFRSIASKFFCSQCSATHGFLINWAYLKHHLQAIVFVHQKIPVELNPIGHGLKAFIWIFRQCNFLLHILSLIAFRLIKCPSLLYNINCVDVLNNIINPFIISICD